MNAPDYTDLQLVALTWNETDKVSCAELVGTKGEFLCLNLDTLEAVALLRRFDHPVHNDKRIHNVLADVLRSNGYRSEAVFLSQDETKRIHCRLLYQKESQTGFLDLQPGDGLVLADLLHLTVWAHRALVGFIDTPSTPVG